MTTHGDDSIKVVPVRHYGQWVSVAVLGLLLAMLFSRGECQDHLQGRERRDVVPSRHGVAL